MPLEGDSLVRILGFLRSKVLKTMSHIVRNEHGESKILMSMEGMVKIYDV